MLEDQTSQSERLDKEAMYADRVARLRQSTIQARKREHENLVAQGIELAEIKSTFGAIKQGVKVGSLLRSRVQDHIMQVYAVVIALAVLKDTIDIASAEAFSVLDWSIDLFISVVMFIFFWGRGTWKVKLVIFIATGIEVVPLLGAFPTWMFCVLYAYLNDLKKNKELKEEADQIEKTIKKKM